MKDSFNSASLFKACRQISHPELSEFKRINQFLFPLKSLEKPLMIPQRALKVN